MPVFERRFWLTRPPKFHLPVVVKSHGWFDLEPFHWNEPEGEFSFSCTLFRLPVTIFVTQTSSRLHGRVLSFRALQPDERKEAKKVAASCLRLEEDFSEFHRLLAKDARLSWVNQQGAGRLLRSPSRFEDLVKIICTTNCSWHATKRMVSRLVQAAGQRAPHERKTFPGPKTLAKQSTLWFRREIGAGYRAPYLKKLSDNVHHSTQVLENWTLNRPPTDELKAHLHAIEGIGPYAATHALRLLGVYEDPGLDSWCRKQFQRIYKLRTAPSDQRVVRRYRTFGKWLGLALWMDLTRDWHCPPE